MASPHHDAAVAGRPPLADRDVEPTVSDPLDHAFGPRGARVFRVLLFGIPLALAAAASPSGMLAPVLVAVAWVLVVTPTAWYLARRRSPGAPALSNLVTVVDVLGTAAIVAVSGGAESPVRWLLVCTPILWAWTRPKDLHLVIASGAVGYLAASIPDVLDGTPDLRRTMASFFLVYVGASAASCLLSGQRTTQQSLVRRLRRLRTELRGQHLVREREELEELVGRLHDGPLQLVATVGQDLDDHAAGIDVDLARSRRLLRDAAAQMRSLNAERFETVIGDADLAAALRHDASRVERRGGPRVAISVGMRVAGPHDETVRTAVGELLANAVKHAQATVVEVDLVRDRDDCVVLTITDDGVGMCPQDRADAEAAGHMGLRHLERRIEAIGGDVHVATGAAGTTVRVCLPGDGPASGDGSADDHGATGGDRNAVDAAPDRPDAGELEAPRRSTR